MSKFTKARSQERNAAEEADHYYGAAFRVRNRDELAESMAEWSELSEDERSFIVAHLVYLGIKQSGHMELVLEEMQDVLEEMLEGPEPEAQETEPVEEVPASPPVLEVVPDEVLVPDVLVPEEVPDDAA